MTTFTVGTSGRTYSTWDAAAAALPANLVTDGNSYILEGYNDSEFSTGGTTTLTLTGHTTDSTHFITVTAAAGESFRDIDSNELNYNTSNGVSLVSNEYGINCTDDWTVVTRLQLKSTNSTADRAGLRIFADNCTAEDCLCVGQSHIEGGAGIFLYNTNVLDPLVINCVFIQDADSARAIVSGYTARLHGCALVVPSHRTPSTSAIRFLNAQSCTVTNCAIFNCAAVDDLAGATITFTTCMTDVASPPSGCSTVTYADQFEGTTSNWRVKAGADLIGAGTYEGSYPGDIFGVTRANPPTIGAMEFPSEPDVIILGSMIW